MKPLNVLQTSSACFVKRVWLSLDRETVSSVQAAHDLAQTTGVRTSLFAQHAHALDPAILRARVYEGVFLHGNKPVSRRGRIRSRELRTRMCRRDD